MSKGTSSLFRASLAGASFLVLGWVAPAYAQAAYPSHFVYDGLPEGLRRERKGPLNPGSGRATGI